MNAPAWRSGPEVPDRPASPDDPPRERDAFDEPDSEWEWREDLKRGAEIPTPEDFNELWDELEPTAGEGEV